MYLFERSIEKDTERKEKLNRGATFVQFATEIKPRFLFFFPTDRDRRYVKLP